MTKEEENRIIVAFGKAMRDLQENKINTNKGSYDDPYIFVCTKALARKIKKLYNVDKNNIFCSFGVYYKICVQKPFRKTIRLEVKKEAKNE